MHIARPSRSCRGGPLARQSPRRALRRPVILPGTPQVVIPHVAPCTCTLVRKGRPASRAWCPAGPPGGVGLEVTGHPEGVGDPEKALRLAFKALQPLNPPRGGRRGPNRLSWAILWPVP